MLRAREVVISADRPFTMYADGDPIGELPVRVSALPGAVTMLVPAPDRRIAVRRAAPLATAPRPAANPPRRRPRTADGERRDELGPARQARARAGRRRALAPARRRRDERARQGPDAPRHRTPSATLGARLRRAACSISATNGKTTTAAMAAGDPRAGRHHARAQPGRREHGRRDRHDAARRRARARRDRRRARAVRGRRAVAGRARRAAAPARDPARQPVPRPARPLRRARDDRRALGSSALGTAPTRSSCSTPTTR